MKDQDSIMKGQKKIKKIQAEKLQFLLVNAESLTLELGGKLDLGKRFPSHFIYYNNFWNSSLSKLSP